MILLADWFEFELINHCECQRVGLGVVHELDRIQVCFGVTAFPFASVVRARG